MQNVYLLKHPESGEIFKEHKKGKKRKASVVTMKLLKTSTRVEVLAKAASVIITLSLMGTKV